MKSRSIALIALVLLCVSVGVHPARTLFDEGSVECGWNEGDIFVIDLQLNDDLAQPGTWVLTLTADRFADGIFAWQLHVSDRYQSLLVIPNDFLTARNFLPETLGVVIAASPAEGSLEVRIPQHDAIPNLIAEGDEIRIHALWVRSGPLVTFLVPGKEGGTAGGGGGTEAGTDPLPDRDTYLQGETIDNSFVLIDPETGMPRLYVPASYSLLRVREGEADEFLRFAQIEQDRETGVFSYRIDTSRLKPGRYRLIVAIGSGEKRFEKVLTIAETSEGSP